MRRNILKTRLPAVFICLLLTSVAAHADRVAAGDNHNLAAKWDGSQFVWGANDNGQFGDGTTLDALNPVPVVDINYNALDRALAVVSHGDNNLVLIDDDTLIGWGPNENYQLGSGLPYSGRYLGEVAGDSADNTDNGEDTGDDPETPAGNPIIFPEKVVDPEGKPIANIVAIALGANFAAAINQEGNVLAWGNLEAFRNREQSRDPVVSQRERYYDPYMEFSNSRYKDGDPATDYELMVMQDAAGNRYTGIVEIAVGDSHLLALTADGQVLAWGENTAGQLGDGSNAQRPFPVYVRDQRGVSLAGVTSIAAHGDGSFAVRNGDLLGWGSSLFTSGEVFAGHLSDPEEVGIGAIRRVAPGASHVLAITVGGEVIGWGSNSNGQLGVGHNGDVSGTAKVITRSGQRLDRVDEIAVGENHSLAVRLDGQVYAWGIGENGQLGDGTNVDSYFAVNVRNRQNSPFSLY